MKKFSYLAVITRGFNTIIKIFLNEVFRWVMSRPPQDQKIQLTVSN